MCKFGARFDTSSRISNLQLFWRICSPPDFDIVGGEEAEAAVALADPPTLVHLDTRTQIHKDVSQGHSTRHWLGSWVYTLVQCCRFLKCGSGLKSYILIVFFLDNKYKQKKNFFFVLVARSGSIFHGFQMEPIQKYYCNICFSTF